MADNQKPKVAWFEHAETGVKFAVNEGSPVHERVTHPRNKPVYKPTSAPRKGDG